MVIPAKPGLRSEAGPGIQSFKQHLDSGYRIKSGTGFAGVTEW